MAHVYILPGSKGRYYIGCTENLDRRLEEHRRGSCHTTKRLGDTIDLITSVEVSDMKEARKIERFLKQKKDPQVAVHYLQKG